MSKDSAAAKITETDASNAALDAKPEVIVEKPVPTGELKVAGIMITEVFSVTPNMTVRQAIELLITHKISGAPVVDQSHTVVSIVSEGDLLKLAATIGLDKKIATGLDRLVTSDKIVTAKKTDSFAEVYRTFLKHAVHRVIVVDGNQRLLGIVSRSNVLRLLANLPAE